MPARTIIPMLLAGLIALIGCAHQPAIGPDDPRFPTVGFLREHDATTLGRALLINSGTSTDHPQSRPILSFNSEPVWRYLIRYGVEGNDCPQGQLDSDCAHFQAHALAAAGIKVSAPSAACIRGLTIRVKDLAIAFDNASRRYANVIKFTDPAQARRGDYCFLPRTGGALSDHLMVLAAAPDADGAFVFAHTNNRYGTFAPFDPSRCVFYRIEQK